MLSNISAKIEDRAKTEIKSAGRTKHSLLKNMKKMQPTKSKRRKKGKILKRVIPNPKRLFPITSPLFYLSSIQYRIFNISPRSMCKDFSDPQIIMNPLHSCYHILCVDSLQTGKWVHITSVPDKVWKKYIAADSSPISPRPIFKLLLTHLSNTNPLCYPSVLLEFDSKKDATAYADKLRRFLPNAITAKSGTNPSEITRERIQSIVTKRESVAKSEIDPNCTLVHLDRIPSTVSHSALVSMCNSIGDVVRCQIQRDDMGFRTGMAVVEMKDHLMAWKLSEYFHSTKSNQMLKGMKCDHKICSSSTALYDETWKHLDGFTSHCIQIGPIPMKLNQKLKGSKVRSLFDVIFNALTAAQTTPSLISFYPSIDRRQRHFGRAIIRFEDQGDVFRAINHFDGKSISELLGDLNMNVDHCLDEQVEVKYLAVDPFGNMDRTWCWVRIENVPTSITEEMLIKGIEYNGIKVVDVMVLKPKLSRWYPNRVMVRCPDPLSAHELAMRMNGSDMNGHKVWSITVGGYRGTNEGDDNGVPTKTIMLYPIPCGTGHWDIRALCEHEHAGAIKYSMFTSNAAQYPVQTVVRTTRWETANELAQKLNGIMFKGHRLRAIHLMKKKYESNQRKADNEAIHGIVFDKVKFKLKQDPRKKYNRLKRSERALWPKWKRAIYWPSVKPHPLTRIWNR